MLAASVSLDTASRPAFRVGSHLLAALPQALAQGGDKAGRGGGAPFTLDPIDLYLKAQKARLLPGPA